VRRKTETLWLTVEGTPYEVRLYAA